jgi:DNA-binding YbaB/EbfC family protein
MGMGNLQRMAMQMQQEMERIQAELAETEIEGSAGGGVVRAVVTGKQSLVSITIDPSAVDSDDVEMLQDLVVVAINEALDNSRRVADQKLGAMQSLGALGGPGGLGGLLGR